MSKNKNSALFIASDIEGNIDLNNELDLNRTKLDQVSLSNQLFLYISIYNRQF